MIKTTKLKYSDKHKFRIRTEICIDFWRSVEVLSNLFMTSCFRRVFIQLLFISFQLVKNVSVAIINSILMLRGYLFLVKLSMVPNAKKAPRNKFKLTKILKYNGFILD